MMLQAPHSYYKLNESTLRRLARQNKTGHQKPPKTQSNDGSNSTPHAPRVKLPHHPTTQPVFKDVLAMPTSAWDTETVLVQPFRRTQHKPAPLGVPSLDLSKFNEPDSKMEPIRIRVAMTTERSQLSWGTYPIDSGTAEPEQLIVEDVCESSDSEATPPLGDEPNNTSVLEPAQTKFIEAKLMSNERSQPQPALNGVLPRHPETRGRPVMVPEASLNKKLRFEARVLTQNGRDVHRELCGFFFLADNSLTVYEFRQFGKKSSALPIIQRGVYSHVFGAQRGDPYEINIIKKGKTLHFHTSDHPGLPDTLSARPVLALRITCVDETAKKLLLTEGLNPMEVRQVEQYLTDSDVPQDLTEDQLRKTLQGLVVGRLTGRASKTLVGLGRQLVAMGDRVTKQQLQQALRNYHISLTVEDMNQLWVCICSEQNDVKVSFASSLHSNGHHSNSSSLSGHHGNSSATVDGLLSHLIGPLPEDRSAHIRKVFRKLDSMKTGVIEVEIFRRFFSASQHPSVLAGLQTAEGVWSSLTECLQPVGRATAISYADFEHYYHGVSLDTDKDTDFVALLKNSWSL